MKRPIIFMSHQLNGWTTLTRTFPHSIKEKTILWPGRWLEQNGLSEKNITIRPNVPLSPACLQAHPRTASKCVEQRGTYPDGRVGWSVYARWTGTISRQGCHQLISLQACNFSVCRNVTGSVWGQQNHPVPSGMFYLSPDFIFSWKITSWEDLSSELLHPFPCHRCVEGRKVPVASALIFALRSH